MTNYQKTKWAVIGLILLLLLIFMYQNSEPVTVRFLGLTFDSPPWALILVAFAAGVVTGLIGPVRHRIKPR